MSLGRGLIQETQGEQWGGEAPALSPPPHAHARLPSLCTLTGTPHRARSPACPPQLPWRKQMLQYTQSGDSTAGGKRKKPEVTARQQPPTPVRGHLPVSPHQPPAATGKLCPPGCCVPQGSGVAGTKHTGTGRWAHDNPKRSAGSGRMPGNLLASSRVCPLCRAAHSPGPGIGPVQGTRTCVMWVHLGEAPWALTQHTTLALEKAGTFY